MHIALFAKSSIKTAGRSALQIQGGGILGESQENLILVNLFGAALLMLAFETSLSLVGRTYLFVATEVVTGCGWKLVKKSPNCCVETGMTGRIAEWIERDDANV